MNPQASYLLEAPNQIAGSFNANSLIEDEETGFLTQSLKCSEVQRVGSLGGISPLSKFNVKQKLLILLKLLQRWNITWACSQVGISRYTFQNHYTLDKSFAQCVDMIRYRSIDDVNEVRFTVAKTHAGAFDRMCLLNAYMPEVYNPKIQVEVQHKMSSSEATARSTGIQDAIDAEVVETVKRIKAAKNK